MVQGRTSGGPRPPNLRAGARSSEIPRDHAPAESCALLRGKLFDDKRNAFRFIEKLAGKAGIHPKVMREALKLAFLAPDIVTYYSQAKRRSS
jgi:hypothetical protein